jgi:MFS family permease
LFFNGYNFNLLQDAIISRFMIQRNSPGKTIHFLGLAICVSLLGDLALFASLPVKGQSLGISLTQVGILLGIHRVIRIPGNAIGAVFINRSRRKPFFIAGMVLAVLSTGGYAAAHGIWLFVFTRILWGIAWILIYISSMTMLMDVTIPQNRGQWSGVYNTWYLVGIASGSAVGGYLTDMIGFRNAMFWSAIFSAMGLVLFGLFVPETKPFTTNGETNTPNPYRWGWTITQTWAKMWGYSRSVPGLSAVTTIYMINQFAGEGVAISTFSFLLLEKYGSQFSLGWLMLGVASMGGSMIALRYVLSAILSPIIGKISDQNLGRSTVIIVGITAGIVSFLIFGYASSLGYILVGIVFNALSGSALSVILAATLGDLSPAGKEGEMIGVYATAGDIGSAAGPLFAYLSLPYISLSAVYMICSLLFSASLLAARKLKNSISILGAEI